MTRLSDSPSHPMQKGISTRQAYQILQVTSCKKGVRSLRAVFYVGRRCRPLYKSIHKSLILANFAINYNLRNDLPFGYLFNFLGVRGSSF